MRRPTRPRNWFRMQDQGRQAASDDEQSAGGASERRVHLAEASRVTPYAPTKLLGRVNATGLGRQAATERTSTDRPG